MIGSLYQWAAAASDSGSSIDITTLLAPVLSTGVVGAVLVMLLFEIGFITKKSADREREAAEASHAAEIKTKDDLIESLRTDVTELKVANGSLQILVQEKMIPALVQATDISKGYVAELARRNERLSNDS